MKEMTVDINVDDGILFVATKAKYRSLLIEAVLSNKALIFIMIATPTMFSAHFSPIMELSDFEQLAQRLAKLVKELEGGD